MGILVISLYKTVVKSNIDDCTLSIKYLAKASQVSYAHPNNLGMNKKASTWEALSFDMVARGRIELPTSGL